MFSFLRKAKFCFEVNTLLIEHVWHDRRCWWTHYFPPLFDQYNVTILYIWLAYCWKIVLQFQPGMVQCLLFDWNSKLTSWKKKNLVSEKFVMKIFSKSSVQEWQSVSLTSKLFQNNLINSSFYFTCTRTKALMSSTVLVDSNSISAVLSLSIIVTCTTIRVCDEEFE